MLHPLTPRSLLIGVLWLASIATQASATAVISATGDEKRIATPSGEFQIDVASSWAANEFTETILGEDRVRSEFPEELSSLAEIDVSPPDETRREARVPEPATLALVGSSLIALANAARRKSRKRPLQRLGRVRSEIRYRAVQPEWRNRSTDLAA